MHCGKDFQPVSLGRRQFWREGRIWRIPVARRGMVGWQRWYRSSAEESCGALDEARLRGNCPCDPMDGLDGLHKIANSASSVIPSRGQGMPHCWDGSRPRPFFGKAHPIVIADSCFRVPDKFFVFSRVRGGLPVSGGGSQGQRLVA